MENAGLAKASDAVIYLPGIMGSELVDGNGDIVWGLKPSLIFRQAVFGNVLDRIALRPNDDIRASRPVQFPVTLPLLSSMEPYRALDDRLKSVVVRPEAVRPFAYDWRKSIADAAQKLAPVVREHFEHWQQLWKSLPDEDKKGLPEPRLTLVGHSMGGLVASYFTAFVQGGELVRKVVTLGTPFGGSLNAVNILATGKGFPLGAFGSSLSATARTLPGLYELMARWKCVADTDSPRNLTPADLEGIGANRELAEAATATLDKLDMAFDDAADHKPPVRCLVGTTQPTRQTVRFRDGMPEFFEDIDGTDHRGDGTVFRYSAIPCGVEPSYLPQSHGALAKTQEAVEFVAAVLTERDLGDFQAPPGVGLRVPEIVAVGEPFAVDILDGEPGLTCHLSDAEENRLVTMVQTKEQDGTMRAELTIPSPGLYRVAVSGGGYSPVERLVCAIS